MKMRFLLLFIPVFYYSVGIAQIGATSLVGIHNAPQSFIDTMSNPITGSLIYNTDQKSVFQYDGTEWNKLRNSFESKLIGDSLLIYINDNNDTVFFNYKNKIEELEQLTSFGIVGDSLYYVDENGDSTKVYNDTNALTSFGIVGDSLVFTDANSKETKIYLQDLDTTNELIDSVTYINDTLKIYEGDSIFTVEITGSGVDSIKNERNDSIIISSGGTNFNIESANTMAEIYDVTGGYTLSRSYSKITLGTPGIVDPNYTTTNNSITVTKAGRYRITYRITTDYINSLNSRAGSEYRLVKNGVNVIPGTYSAAYHRVRSIGVGTAVVVKVVYLDAGNTISVEGRKYYVGNSILKTSPNGSSLLIERL